SPCRTEWFHPPWAAVGKEDSGRLRSAGQRDPLIASLPPECDRRNPQPRLRDSPARRVDGAFRHSLWEVHRERSKAAGRAAGREHWPEAGARRSIGLHTRQRQSRSSENFFSKFEPL